MPPERSYGPPVSPQRYFRLVYDTMDVPPEQDFGDHVVLTPTFDKLHIYGREVGSPFPEDIQSFRRLAQLGRLMGEWFSVACPEGEMGSQAIEELTEITAEEFSAAYQRGWEKE